MASHGAMPPPPPPPPPPGAYQQATGNPSHQPQPHTNGRQEQRHGSHHRQHGHDGQRHDKHHHDKHKGHDKHKSHDKHHSSSKPAKPAAPAPAPVAQPTSSALDTRLRRETPFLATVRFKNDLPEVPGDPKLLVVQHAPEKLAAFSLTSLEKENKHELILPPDLGISLSMLDMERYAVTVASKPALHPDDLKLLGPEADSLLMPGGAPLAGLSKGVLGQGGSPGAGIRRGAALRNAAEVSWLMRTTYMSAEADATKGKREQNEYDARRQKERLIAGEEVEAGDEESQRLAQIRIIEQTFAAARAAPVHRTKPGMRALEVMEVLPDVDWWAHKFMSAHFDKDPAEEVDELLSLNNPDLARQMVGMGVLKGFKLEEQAPAQVPGARPGAAENSGGRFMALLLPRNVPAAAAVLKETGTSGVPNDKLEGEYSWAREYSYDLVNKQTKKPQDTERVPSNSNLQQAYLMRFQSGKALYCELNSTLELRSKREAGARSRSSSQFQRPSKVVLRKRGMNANEVEDGKRRCLALRSANMAEEEEEPLGGGEGGDEGGLEEGLQQW